MTLLLHPDADGISAAASIIRAGGLVAFPTETVYGLGADGLSAGAVGRIFAAKGRPQDNPLILHVDSVKMAESLSAGFSAAARALAARFWPGPLSIVVARNEIVPATVTAGLASVALRMPAHPAALALIKAAGLPIAAPSANVSGRPSPTCAEDVVSDLEGRIDAVISGGRCEVGVESTVVDATSDIVKMLRPGGISREMLAEDLGYLPEVISTAAAHASPGTRHTHYRPRCSVRLFDSARAQEVISTAGARDGIVTYRTSAPDMPRFSASIGSIEEYASRLYSLFREADRAAVEVLHLQLPPEDGLGLAVCDRLRRAADR